MGPTHLADRFASRPRAASDRYDAQLREAVERGLEDPQAIFFELGLDDIRRAAL